MTLTLGLSQSEEELGTKDALHVSVVIARSNDYLYPGDWVKFTGEDLNYVKECRKTECHGIVDPFSLAFKIGTPFLVLLRPGVTKNLKHSYDLTLEFDETDKEEWEDDGCRGCNS